MVNLFNIGHGNVIYCVKLLCITVAIVNGYGAIAHGRGNLVYLLLSSCCACNVTVMYAFVYQKAFAIPDGVECVKRRVAAEVHLVRDLREKKILRRRKKSFPSTSVGLKVGDFHMLERESTPIFVDFMLKNVMNLLVTLK